MKTLWLPFYLTVAQWLWCHLQLSLLWHMVRIIYLVAVAVAVAGAVPAVQVDSSRLESTPLHSRFLAGASLIRLKISTQGVP